MGPYVTAQSHSHEQGLHAALRKSVFQTDGTASAKALQEGTVLWELAKRPCIKT